MGEGDVGGVRRVQGVVKEAVLDAGTIPKPKIPLPISTSSKTKDMPDTTAISKDTMDTSAVTKRDWNTSKLGLRVGADALSAGAAGALVAPIITMIDKAIIENASGRNSLGDSLKQSARELLLRPHRFIGSKPFALIFVRAPTLLLLLLLHTLLHTLFHIHPTHC
jgi:hypothetical protein